MTPSRARRAALNTVLGRSVGRGLGTCSWRELEDAATREDHPFTRWWTPGERARLAAALALCRLYYPAQPVPSVVDGVPDVVRHFTRRCRELADRVVWLLTLDGDGHLKDEVLVVYGGSLDAVPALRTVLRQALRQGAERLYVVDYRPLEFVTADAPTLAALATLQEVGRAVGLVVEDWVLLGPNGALSVAEMVSAHQDEAA
jgi:hypothetical protein